MRRLIQEIQENNIGISVVNDELELNFEGDQIDPYLIDKIRENKEELISMLKKYNARDGYEKIKPVQVEASYPLSNAQRRLWYTCQIGDNSNTYNLPNDVFLQNISAEKFKEAVYQVVKRHEVLRTTFREDEQGEIRQWVLNADELNFEVEYKDFSNQNSSKEIVRQYIDGDKLKAFDLENGPLLKAVLFQTSNDEYIFYYNMHHIISDDWSMEVLIKDTISYYEALLSETAPNLYPLDIQYKDYSVWQAKQKVSDSYKEHRAYWLDKFSGELPILNLVSNVVRPKVKTNNGKFLKTYILPETKAAIDSFVLDNGGSLFMTLLTAWNLLLYKYTSQKDVVIGASLAGRDHADLENQIGFYIKTLAIRNQINPNENTIDFYKRVTESVLSDFVYNQYPYDTLVEELDMVRDISRNPLFDIMITLQNASKNNNIGAGQKITNDIVDLGESKSKFDLDIEFIEIDNSIGFNIVYNTDIYEKSFIERLMVHYKLIINDLVRFPEKNIANINYLTKEEKQKLLIDFNKTETDFITKKTIIDLFNKQVKEKPESVALICEGDSFSYKELDERSNQVANFLITKGVSNNDIIPLCLDRSLDLFACILGILKCGGTYVPIDPNLPKERINYILKDTKGKIALTSVLFDNMLDEEFTSLICIESKEIQLCSKESPKVNVSLESLAYIIYTSGTTGKPKGVEISHKALTNYIQYAMTTYFIESQLKCVLFTSISFDLTVTSIFTPLCTGGTIDIITSMEHDVEVLNALGDKNFDVLKLTPSHVEALIGTLNNKHKSYEGKGSKVFILGGEPLPAETVKKLYTYYGDKVTIWNEYGPTESTVGCISEKLETNDVNLIVPIGKPTSNVKAYILDAFLEPVPIGVIGELYLGGEQLANGYLNLPKLTQDKFIINPFNKKERLYKTGDLAKWIENGKIVYNGRIDNQVKIKGYRIELDEIIQHLRSKPGIDEAIVIAKELQEGDKELVAYIVSSNEQNSEELREYLSSFLPNYMLPSYYIQLESLLLTKNGKIDQKALPIPDYINSGSIFIPPSNDTELKVFEIWKKHLSIEKIGINDNFFSLGGNSIKGIKIIGEIQKELEIKLDAVTLFRNPTIKNLSEIIDTKSWHTEDQSNKEIADKLII